MSERAYTVREVEDLRTVVRTKLVWGTYDASVIPNNSVSHRQVSRSDVEAVVRTHMQAGHTATDLLGRPFKRWDER